MTQTEALKIALDALEHCKDVIEERGLNGNPEFAKMWGLTLSIDRANQAITAIKEALAQPIGSVEQETAETFAYKADYWKRMHDEVRVELIKVLNAQPVIQPKYWVSLSDDDKIDCANYDYRNECVDATDRKLRELNEVQQHKPMPLKEVERILYVNTKLNPNLRDDQELIGYIVNAVRAIEAAHGIKE